MIRELGRVTDREMRARAMAAAIESSFNTLTAPLPGERKKAAYLIWRRPYMAAASATFIHEMLESAGFVNAFRHLQRYPEIELEDLNQLKPDLVLLSSEPYPFKEAHLQEVQSAVPGGAVALVDGELFSWYGSRLLKSAAYFAELRERFG